MSIIAFGRKPGVNRLLKLHLEAHPSAIQLLFRLLRYLRPYRWTCAGVLLALTVLSLSNTGFLATIKTVTDEGFARSQGHAQHAIWYLPGMLCGLLLVRASAGFTAGYGLRIVGRSVVEAIRLEVFQHLLRLPVSLFDQHAAGYFASKLTFDCEQLYNAVTKVVASAVRDSLTILGILVYMLYLDWQLTLLFVMITPLIAMYLKRMSPKLRNSGKYVQDSISEMTQIVEEVVNGQRVVKTYAGEVYEYQRFAERAARNRQMMIRLGRLSGLNSMVVEVLAALALGLVVFYAVGRFSAGEFAAFISALLMLIGPIKAMTSINEDVQIAIAACTSVFKLLDEAPEAQGGQQHVHQPVTHITFNQVSLAYPASQRAVLSNLEFTIKAGEKLALVGASGGGKTSLVNLLPMFYLPSAGQIMLNGLPLSAYTLSSLRQQFSVVSQDTLLFNDTVYRNIAYGELANHTEAAVIAAAKAANAWAFIQKMPQGIYSEIGDNGVRLSGGQRQRLSIARAILKNSPILILDEATSALDSTSEVAVQTALNQLMQGKTVIMIAHRLSTIQDADRILVMEDGNIVESGTHQSLMQLQGVYARLYQQVVADTH